MSTVHTYFDPEAGVWRNRLAGRAPFPREFGDVVSAVAAGQPLARLFGAAHVVVHPSGHQQRVPPLESRDTAYSA